MAVVIPVSNFIVTCALSTVPLPRCVAGVPSPGVWLLSSPPPVCGCQMMEVLQENHELVFLYSLVKGQGDSSQACHIAATAGLPREVVDRGAEVRRDHSA